MEVNPPSFHFVIIDAKILMVDTWRAQGMLLNPLLAAATCLPPREAMIYGPSVEPVTVRSHVVRDWVTTVDLDGKRQVWLDEEPLTFDPARELLLAASNSIDLVIADVPFQPQVPVVVSTDKTLAPTLCRVGVELYITRLVEIPDVHAMLVARAASEEALPLMQFVPPSSRSSARLRTLAAGPLQLPLWIPTTVVAPDGATPAALRLVNRETDTTYQADICSLRPLPDGAHGMTLCRSIAASGTAEHYAFNEEIGRIL